MSLCHHFPDTYKYFFSYIENGKLLRDRRNESGTVISAEMSACATLALWLKHVCMLTARRVCLIASFLPNDDGLLTKSLPGTNL